MKMRARFVSGGKAAMRKRDWFVYELFAAGPRAL